MISRQFSLLLRRKSNYFHFKTKLNTAATHLKLPSITRHSSTLSVIDDQLDVSFHDSAAHSLEQAIQELRAETSWKLFLQLKNAENTHNTQAKLPESASDIGGLSNLSLDTLFKILSTLANYGIQNNETVKRVSTIGQLIRSNYKLTSSEFTILLKHLAKGRAFDDCLDTMDDMKRTGIDLSQYSFEKIVYEMISNHKVEEGLKLSSEYRQRGVESTPSLFSKLIAAFAHIKDLESAESTLEAKIRSGHCASWVDYSLIIGGYIKKKKFEEAEKWIKNMLRLDISLSKEVTSSLAYFYSKYDFDCTKKWFEEHLKMDPERLSSGAWNSMLYALVHKDSLDEAIELFRDMRKNGPILNESTHHIMMDAFVKKNQVEIAHSLFEKMIESGMKPSVLPYSILINGYVRRKEMDNVSKVLERMKEDDIAPNIVAFNTLINGYVKTRDIDTALEIYNYCKNSGMSIDTWTCSTLMFGTSVNGRYEDTFQIYKDMQDLDLELNEYTYTALIYSFSKRGDGISARKMLNQMKIQEQLSPNIYNYNALLAGFVAANDVKEAYKTLHEMRELELSPNLGTYNILMELSSAEGRVDNVLKFFNILIRDEGISIVDSYTVSNVLRLLGKHENVEELKSTFFAVKCANDAGKIKLDHFVWMSYVNSLAQNKCFTEAVEEMKSMLNAGHIPQEKHLEDMIRIFREENRWDEIDDIVKTLETNEKTTLGNDLRADHQDSSIYMQKMFE